MHIHLSNEAMKYAQGATLLSSETFGKHEEARKYAEGIYNWLEFDQPAANILISTGGDEINPLCTRPENDPFHLHQRCRTRDNLAAYYLITRQDWEQQKPVLEKAHNDWLTSRNHCFLDGFPQPEPGAASADILQATP